MKALFLLLSLLALPTLPCVASDDATSEEAARVDESLPMPEQVLRVGPEYPYNLKRKGIQGSAVVEFIIEKDGRVKYAEPVKCTRSEFGHAAVAAVRKWRFRPTEKNGRLVRVMCRQSMLFQLKMDPAKK